MSGWWSWVRVSRSRLSLFRLALGHLSAALARGLEPSQGPLTVAIRAFFRKRFESRGAYGGVGWPALAASTIKRKMREGSGTHPMIRTGTLMASLTEEGALGLTKEGKASGRTFGYSVLQDDGNRLLVGSWDPVLKMSERGTRHQPARPILVAEIPPREVNQWTALVARQLTR